MKFLKSIERIEADNNPIKLFENCLKQLQTFHKNWKCKQLKTL